MLNNNQSADVIHCFSSDGRDITDKNEIVERFNDYFVNLGSRVASSILTSATSFADYLKSPNPNSFAYYPTNAAEIIINIVSNLNSKWSAGCDAIPVNIIKVSIRHIAEPLSELINKSFLTGLFPDRLKIAKVCPVFKNGDKHLFSNYRPISILPSFSKIYENVVSRRLLSFLEAGYTVCTC